MSKDPTTKADGLRVMREETRGHLQATAETPAGYVEGAKPSIPLPPSKLIPYAGNDRTVVGSRGGIPYSKNPKPDPTLPKPPRKRQKLKRKIA